MPISGYFDTVFGTAGDLTTIPDPVQGDGSVSYSQGWPIAYSTPVTSGGKNIARGSMNQAFYDVTSAIQKYQQNTIAPFITTAMNGGVNPYSYAKYALVMYGGVAYMSLKAANTDTPPSSNWQVLTFRQLLTANTTFYVSTTGNDTTGNGSSGSPWLTIQKAVNYVQQNIDNGGFTCTIQVADGTYSTGASISGPFVGSGTTQIMGNTTTPANCIISSSSDCFTCSSTSLSILGFKLNSSGGSCVNAIGSSVVSVGVMEYSAASVYHLFSQAGCLINCTASYKVTGNAVSHLSALSNGNIFTLSGLTITVTGTPTFTTFALCVTSGVIISNGATYTGAANAVRYDAHLNGVISTGGGGANFFPGSAAGSTSTGGQYA